MVFVQSMNDNINLIKTNNVRVTGNHSYYLKNFIRCLTNELVWTN